MTLHLEWFGLAEAAANDARGALTLVGLNQNIVVTGELPVTRQRVLTVLVVDDEDPEATLTPGREVQLTLAITDPEGEIIAKESRSLELGEKKRQEVPVGLSLVVQAQLTLREYGRYVCQAQVETDGAELSGTKYMYVVRPEGP